MKKRILAFLLAVSIAVSMLVLPASAAGNANTAVQLSITLNAMDSSQQAALNAVVTRSALARMLVSYSTYRESVGSQGTVGTLFTDLPGTSPYAPYVRIAVQNGWMNGYTDGSFRPDNAVTLEEAVTAILTGAKLAAETDADALGVGEMGIGNTTTSSAVLAVLLSAEVETVTGRGGGVTDESFLRKKAIIRQAIEVNRPDRDDPVDVLAKVGGFDLAAMCGAFLGAAATRRPVVIDGFISAVAALCAVRLCPRVRDYLVPSHASFEIGYRLAMESMNLEPLFLLGMRLGEGSGCPLAFQVLSAACAVMNDMATFDQAGIDDGYLDEIRQGDQFTVEGKA